MGFEDTQTQDAREKHAKRKARLANPHRDQLPPSPGTNAPTVEGRVDPELASTVTYGLTVKTMFVEDNLTQLRVITKEEEDMTQMGPLAGSHPVS